MNCVLDVGSEVNIKVGGRGFAAAHVQVQW